MRRRTDDLATENEALRRTVQRYEALLGVVDGVVWEIDPRSQRTLFVNHKIKTLLGYTPEEWMSTPHLWEACIHPDDQERVLSETETANLRGKPYHVEYRAITTERMVVWLRDFTTPVVESGVLRALSGVTIDVTAQKNADLQVKLRQARAYSLVQHSTDVFSVLNAEGRFTYVSPAVKRQHGVAPDEVLGWHFAAHMHRDDLGQAQADFQQVLAAPETKTVGMYRQRRIDGSWGWTEITITNMLSDPHVRGIVTNARDITDRKHAEEALERSEGRFRSLVQNASDLITVLDERGVILYESPSVNAVLGYAPEDLIGHSVLEYLPAETHDEVLRIVAALVTGGAGTTVRPTFRFRHANGEWRALEGLMTNLLGDPHVGGIVINSHDITDRQQAESALKVSQRQLLSSEKLASLGRLTAGLAHEINTPLAATMNYLHVARNLVQEYQNSISNPRVTADDHREIAAETLTALDDAGKTTARIGEFIRQMRSHTRDTVQGVSEFDPVKLAGDTLAMLAHEARAAQVELHLESARSHLMLKGEPGRFTQVLTNLVINAIHACETVTRQRRVDMRFGLQGSELRLQVEDNGAGIPAEVLPKIFDPMFTTKAVGKGTGLGLAIIHDIVQGHFGGRIDVQTQLHRGTIFTVHFNAAAALAREHQRE
ncbi:PAS domain S-box protein [Deinococcus sp. Arct2-2]|uniref:PAS domain-containing sensor histidine kinase n=1 Tax=Deinococcus sp. Arct2-2 TaxID=2568653 RepID=UPI0010A455F1|nr:PAS domain-containing sensor histidine kinase [Deinococcus sp. Arct2-2]THF68989.1 PAS domain S-box protein [Deinococcus sp. Arct2-2]